MLSRRTPKDREHNRWLAHREVALHATFPTEFSQRRRNPIFKMVELEQLGAKRIKERCMNMRIASTPQSATSLDTIPSTSSTPFAA